MKTVYCDVVLAANFVADFTLLKICAEFLHVRISKVRLLSASLLGAVFALACAIFVNYTSLRFFACILFSPVICLIAFGKKKYKQMIKAVFTFAILSFLLCGFVTIFACLSGYNFMDGGMKLWMIVAGGLAMCSAFILAGKGFSDECRIKTVDVRIECLGKSNVLTLMCDSGNLLTDPYSDLPVIILKKDFTSKKESDEDFVKLRTRFIPIKTAQGNGVIKGIKPEKIEIVKGNKLFPIDAVVGFSENQQADYGGTDGIIPYFLVENL